MITTLNRRAFMQALLPSSAALAGALTLAPARAADGKIVFGFFPGAAGVPGMTALLKALQGRYQPDLGLKLSYLPGNSGALALEAVHRAPADGGTVLLTPSSLMTLLPLLRKLPGVDPQTDFVPVSPFMALTVAFAVGPAVPAQVNSVKLYLDWLRANPMQASYGVPGLGTVPHLLGTVMADGADLALKAVAYRGFSSLIDDLTYGSLPAAFLPRPVALELQSTGQTRLLAISGDSRWPEAPTLATLRELGLINFGSRESYGFFVSARTPADKVRELATALQQAMQSPTLRASPAGAQMRALPADAETYAEEIAQERQTWAATITKHRFSLDS